MSTIAPPPTTTPRVGGKGTFGANILTSPTTSSSRNDSNDGGIVGQPPLFGSIKQIKPQETQLTEMDDACW